jgi:intracellular sulfur oxidation DsrE/DsrF family protein
MTESNDAAKGLLLHGWGAGAEQVAGVFRSALNATTALPKATIEIVIQGPAVAALTGDGALAGPVAEVLERGVAVLACQNSMRSAAVDSAELFPGVGTVPSAVAHLAVRQWENWAYIRL